MTRIRWYRTLLRKAREKLPACWQDWLFIRRSERELAALSRHYDPLIAEAERQAKVKAREHPAENPWLEYQSLLSESWAEYELVADEMLNLQTQQLVRRANRLGIPLPEGSMRKGEDNKWWQHSRTYGYRFLTTEGRLEVQRLIRQERKERREAWAFWVHLLITFFGVLAAAIGAFTALVALKRR